jgi:hypothetical protein
MLPQTTQTTTATQTSMEFHNYSLPPGVHVVPNSLLDLRPDSDIDHDLLQPPPITNEKNVFFFWHSGFTNMHPYTRRNIRAWHRRFSKSGWTIYVLDRLPSSPLNVANFLDIHDPGTFPKAFVNGTIGGDYAPQHTSDLVRWPLLLKYGGVYADVGLMQIGDLDKMWETTIANPDSKFEVVSYNCGTVEDRSLTNYFLVAKKNNPFFERCHRLFLHLWAEDGGKTSTEGMWCHPLLNGVPLLGKEGKHTFTEGDKTHGPEEVAKMLSDYIAQGQVMTQVMGLVDEETGWNGPDYCVENIYAMYYMTGSQLINEITAWDGQRMWSLMCLSIPEDGEEETEDQRLARTIVERCLKESFGFKLAHGLILRVIGATLGSLWRKNDGSDYVPGTYAHWLRYGIMNWCPDGDPMKLYPRQDFKLIAPYKTGPLLREK